MAPAAPTEATVNRPVVSTMPSAGSIGRNGLAISDVAQQLKGIHVDRFIEETHCSFAKGEVGATVVAGFEAGRDAPVAPDVLI
jgi:hypothetical protein